MKERLDVLLVRKGLCPSRERAKSEIKAGNVYVNGILLDEPYLSGKSRGECDVEFPLTVPEGAYFVLGDSRETSIDSRTAAVGCVNADAVVGKIICTVWPVRRIGAV